MKSDRKNTTVGVRQLGYSLIELMITLGIIGVLAGIAIPAYNGYVSSSKEGVAKQNARSLASFEETYFYENDTYLAGVLTSTTDTLTAALDWKPEGDDDYFDYKVEKCSSGNITQCYKVTVTYRSDTSISEVIETSP